MAAELPPEQQASYSAIIDDILTNSDLNTVSAKRIRKGLQENVDYDLTPQKEAITNLIMDRFDKFQSKADSINGTAEPAPTANGHAQTDGASGTPPADRSTGSPASPKKRKADSESEELSDIADSPPPKKVKKIKAKVKPEAETDAEIAARLQKELNAVNARSTRGGGAKVKKPLKKQRTPKKKSAAKIKASDDSDVESGAEKPEREKKGGFHKPMHLSEPLSALVGETALSRPQTVKKIWEHIKGHDLQNPSDKREIFCDDAMRAVFKQDKVHMFTMNKLLATHLHPVEESEAS